MPGIWVRSVFTLIVNYPVSRFLVLLLVHGVTPHFFYKSLQFLALFEMKHILFICIYPIKKTLTAFGGESPNNSIQRQRRETVFTSIADIRAAFAMMFNTAFRYSPHTQKPVEINENEGIGVLDANRHHFRCGVTLQKSIRP